MQDLIGLAFVHREMVRSVSGAGPGPVHEEPEPVAPRHRATATRSLAARSLRRAADRLDPCLAAAGRGSGLRA